MLGPIEPGRRSPSIILSGYGWSQKDDESFVNSYDKGFPLLYLLEDNYVEVWVSGRSDYPIKTLTLSELGTIAVVSEAAVYAGAFWKYISRGQCSIPLLWPLCVVYATTSATFYGEALLTLPIGYTFPGRNMKKYTDDARITLRVKRYKKNTDMSMWNFQYGGARGIVARSAGHAFVDRNNDSTIEPAFVSGLSFDEKKHLFETELTGLVN
jgi:hypothetical protein